MDKKSKKLRPGRVILVIFLAIIVLALASPFIYDLIGGFSDYDDIPAIVASDEVRALSVDEDGIVSFSADKAAVYSYAARIQFADRVGERISELPFCSEKTVGFRKFGYELNGDALSFSVKLRLFGFIPVQIHADAELKLGLNEAQIKLNELKYGRWISVPVEKYAEYLNIPGLTEGYTADTSDFFADLYPLDISLRGDEISFSCDLLNETIKDVPDSGHVLADLMPYFGVEDSDAARVLRGETSDVYAGIMDSGALSKLLTGLLKFNYELKSADKKQSLEDAPFLKLEIGDVSVCISGQAADFSEMLSAYEAQLTGLRNEYKKLDGRITADGLLRSDGSAFEAGLPEDWGARIVLQYNREGNPVLKGDDGRRGGSGDWNVLPTPKYSELRHLGGISVPGASGSTVMDFSVALRLPDGTPAIMFLTGLDEFGINVISEEMYNEIVSRQGLSVYCSADIISPNEYHFVTPEISRRDLLFLIP